MGTSVTAILTVTTAPLGVPPGPATGLVVSNLTSSSLTLSWNAPTTGTTPFEYQPQISVSGSGTFTDTGPLTFATTANITGLSAGITYLLQIETFNSTPPNSFSATVAATPSGVAPGAPTGLSVTGLTDTTIGLQWNAPVDGTPPLTYQLSYRSPSIASAPAPAAGESPQGTVITTTSGSITDTFGNVWTLVETSPGSLSVYLNGAPSYNREPDGTIDGTANVVQLIYDNHRPYYQDDLWWQFDGTYWFIIPADPRVFTPFLPTTTALSETITGLISGFSYDIEVAASNSFGPGPASAILFDVVMVTLGLIAPSAPMNLTAGTPTETTIPLSWSASAVGTQPISYIVQWRPHV